MLSIVLVESGRQSFWNGLTCVGLALLGITGLIIRQLYVSKKRYFERVQKYIAHKNSLGKDWKVLIADDHLAASDANRKM